MGVSRIRLVRMQTLQPSVLSQPLDFLIPSQLQHPLQSKTQMKKKKKTWRARKKILRMKSQWTLMKRRMRLRRVMIMRMRIWMTRWLEEKEATVDVIEEGTLTIEKFRAFVSCITRSGEALARYPAIEAILVTDTSRGEEVLRAAEQY